MNIGVEWKKVGFCMLWKKNEEAEIFGRRKDWCWIKYKIKEITVGEVDLKEYRKVIESNLVWLKD